VSGAAGTPLAGAQAGLMACVHCGFCLQSCPTYLALGDENDSPRGRIVLMRAVLDGGMSIDDESVTTHLDRCLGCRACETACPSGVPYGAALEAARETMHASAGAAAERRVPSAERLLLWLIAHPLLFKLVMLGGRILRTTGVARLLGKVSFPMAMLASSAPSLGTRRYRAKGDGARGTVALLNGCVMGSLFPHVHRATRRSLAMNGYSMVSARGAGCCGALHAHTGDAERAREFAREAIAAFERSGGDLIAVNAAGCGATMKEYGRLLAGDPAWAARAAALAARVRDVSELLAAAGPRAGAEVRAVATYDAPCHLLHAQRVSSPPLQVLASIPGLDLVPLTDAEQCCGSAGVYNLGQPEIAEAVLAPKLAHIAETAASIVATGNPGCQMQIGAGLLRAGSGARVVHPVELLDASYSAAARPVRR
jgi:glycolate oxidase iron-sulfur subunit